MRRFRLAFMGTPDFAVPSLDALMAGPDEVVAVVTQPDRPKGRGRKIASSPVKQRAQAKGLPVLQPEKVRGDEGEAFRAELASMSLDLVVVAAFGQILPLEVLELPALGCVNVHASLLPRWRGASPIQWAIAEGDDETGVSIMQMDVGLDTGPVILERRTPIEPEETGGELHDRLSLLGAEALTEALNLIRHGEADPTPQDDRRSTYAPMLTKEHGRLDFGMSAEELERRVRAFDPWPGAFTWIGEEQVKVVRAEVVESHREGCDEGDLSSGEPGAIVGASEKGIDIACAFGVLRIMELRPQGKRSMPARAFVAGRSSLLGLVAR